jgi:hypothetical protein
LLQCEVDTLANGGGLALIARGLKHGHLILSATPQFLEALQGVVAASIIHEDKSDLRLGQELPKIGDRQAKSLVVARDDDYNTGLSQVAMITDAP